ncbi:GNAT family N-acetyltransferase [Luteimonas sp. RD2P54]|uniref:GNAT family N-acetyltransferase n=1 Tax=Luteimonas endophytica TaxID=3042023 RepID=A0ABT6J7K9_9GAMM|nr:GNAT family N-acetyltransferase [Luteimonas endophytica]MDH5822801.1 GNAT family N-acetyltransferase [Luteimonas endophytica]
MATRFRQARRDDLPAIVAMLADDPLGATRETPEDPEAEHYLRAFAAIDADPRHYLAVGEDEAGVNAVVQVTSIPGLSRRGATRALIEAVRVASRCRGQGLGEQLLEHAIDHARAAGASMVQLTSGRSRGDAHRFYERLGFVPSHTGFKLALQPRRPPDHDSAAAATARRAHQGDSR